jgi:hypothetical protein
MRAWTRGADLAVLGKGVEGLYVRTINLRPFAAGVNMPGHGGGMGGRCCKKATSMPIQTEKRPLLLVAARPAGSEWPQLLSSTGSMAGGE